MSTQSKNGQPACIEAMKTRMIKLKLVQLCRAIDWDVGAHFLDQSQSTWKPESNSGSLSILNLKLFQTSWSVVSFTLTYILHKMGHTLWCLWIFWKTYCDNVKKRNVHNTNYRNKLKSCQFSQMEKEKKNVFSSWYDIKT